MHDGGGRWVGSNKVVEPKKKKKERKKPSGERRQNELRGISCKDTVPIRLGPHPTDLI